MNKLFTKAAKLVLGLSLAAGVGVAVGSQNKASRVDAEDEVFYTLTPGSTGSNSSPHNNYGAAATTTIGGIGWSVTGNSNLTPWRIGGKSITGVDREVYSTTAMGSAITKVELTVGAASSITVNSLQLIVGDDDFSPATDTVTETFAANSTITFIPTSGTSWATGQYYKFVFNVTVSGSSNKFVEFSEAKFYRAKSVSSKYTVTYDLNGGVGTSNIPVDNTEYASGAEVTVLGIGDVVKSGYTFVNWSDGVNTFDEDDTFEISTNTTLTAQWYKNDTISVVSGKESNSIYTDDILNLSSCVNADGDGSLSFTVPSVNYFTYDSSTTTITADSTNTGGPATITAHKGEASCSFTVTVVARPSTGTFNLFSGSIEEGDYVFYYNGYTLKAEISSSRFTNVSVTPSNDTIENPNALTIWHVKPNGNYWTIYNEATEKYAGSTNAKNQGALLSSVTDNAKWTVTGSSTYQFENLARSSGSDPNNKWLRQNGTNGWACYSTSTGGALSLYKLEDSRTITNSRLTNGTVSASNLDSDWVIDGFVFEVQYDNESTWYEVDASVEVEESLPTITASGTTNVTVTATYKSETIIVNNFQATLTYIETTSIRLVYEEETGEYEGNFYGYYMYHTERTAGGNTYYDIFVGNGDYGMLVYGATSDPSGWTPYSTCLSVSGGYLTIFHNLYELSSYVNKTDYPITVSVLNPSTQSAEIAKVETVTTYDITGTEDGTQAATQKKASRLARIRGTITKLESYNSSTHVYTEIQTYSDATDVRVTIELSSGESAVAFVKPSFASADLKAALVKDDEITLKGFTSIYDEAFQLSYPELVPVSASYGAAEFAQDLLDQTDAICQASDHGNLSSLSPIWLSLETNEYASIGDSAEIQALVDAEYDIDEFGVVTARTGTDQTVAEGMARYDHICKAYGLKNFINRSAANSARITLPLLINQSNNTVIIIIVISMVSVTAIGGYFFLKKRREQQN